MSATKPINSDLRRELWGVPDTIRDASTRPLPEDLIDLIRAGRFDYGLWLARGTSKLAAMWLSMVFFQLCDFRVFHLPFSAGVGRPGKDLSRVIYFALSESGRTPEVLRAVAVGKSLGATCYGVVNTMESGLAAMADYHTFLDAGNDEGFALNSFIAMTVHAARLADAIGGGGRVGPGHIEAAGDLAARILENNPLGDLIPIVREARRVMLLGRGLLSPIAGNVSLKFREIPLMPCDAKSGEEFLHGYAEAGSRKDCVCIVLVDEAFLEPQRKTALLLKNRGSNLVVLCPERLRDAMPQGLKVFTVPTPGSPILTPISFAVGFYRMLYGLVMEIGLDADDDELVGKVVSPASFRAEFEELS